MPQPSLVQVAPFAPLDRVLTYSVPPTLEGAVEPGCRVLVPLGRRRVMGLVLELGGTDDAPAQLKPVAELLDPQPVLDTQMLELVRWTAAYYMAPLGEVARCALPAALHTRERQRVRITAEGQRALQAQQALLRSDSDALDRTETELLQRLSRAKSRGLSLGSVGGRGGALSRLMRRGLAQQLASRQGEGRVRTELELELVPPVDPAPLDRAPRQRELVELLSQLGGRARLSALRARLPRVTAALAQRLAQRGQVRLRQVEVAADPFAAEGAEPQRDRPPRLTDEQRQALGPMQQAALAGQYASFLLHGVTSSGKTEVYLHLIADQLEQQRGAIVLVPEISLTPQLVARFRARFGDQVAVLHSGLTDAERYHQWRRIRGEDVSIVVGARSAIFAPLPRLGVVIVDEEHDASFKQGEGVRYNARDLAQVRGRAARAVVVLGSATPSLESYRGAQGGRLQLLQMPHRATPRPLPEVELVDLKRFQCGPEGFLSAPLAAALGQVLERREQAILFLNRRGFSTFMLCKLCGHVVRCCNCSVSLTYHRQQERLVCHYCGYARPTPPRCPDCHGEGLQRMGLGTEQVEQGLIQRFPEARVARLDRDTAAGSGLRQILRRVNQGEVDILVGTQMVTKGHDFPNVTLVGVLSADLGLHFPDFRASERTFQLLTQVAGRAGRGDRPGRVLIQTYSPEHPSVHHAKTHDYAAFFAEESEARKELLYPPWGHLAALRVDGRDSGGVERCAELLAAQGRRLRSESLPVQILGPAEAPLQRLKGRERWLLLLKAEQRKPLRQLLWRLLAGARAQCAPGVRISVDVDPLMML